MTDAEPVDDSDATTVAQLRQLGVDYLAGVSDTVNVDVQLLLADSVVQTPAWLMAWPDKTVPLAARQSFQRALERRKKGEPIAYILGTQPFWTIELAVTPDTLIPRPETELLIETVLAIASQFPEATVLDLGTGTGAIALALASECPHWQLHACDYSEAALRVAQSNGKALDIEIHWQHSNWYSAYQHDRDSGDGVGQRFSIIVSNPPYIEDGDQHLQQGDVRFEPLSALVSGDDGLNDIRIIVAGARQHLHAGGYLFIEHGYNQGLACRQLFQQSGFDGVVTQQDLQGHDRVTWGQWNP